MKKIFCFALLFYVFPFFANEWQWDDITFDNLHFPTQFLWGSATAEYQNSGAETCKNNNWAEWENSFDANSNPRIINNQKSGNSTDHWNRYNEDIQLMKDLGLNAYRFSIEWSLIEPEEGKFDEQALNHYKDLVAALLENNITPMVTLHHFTNPNWFQEKGSFENEENNFYFIRFCEHIFENLSDKVKLWCTINEPAIYAFCGYIMGSFPPGEVNFQKAGEVLRNLLIAHSQVYEKLKQMPNGKECQIGLVHNVLKFEQYHSWNLFEYIPCNFLSMITNNAVMEFLNSGSFYFYIPFKAYVSYENIDKPKIDFIGLNYYSHPLVKMQISYSEPFQSSCYENEVMSDCHYRFHPEGIYKAIEEVSKLNVPIYITENGIADQDDTKRPVFIKRYLYALSEAIKDGYDVRGYFYWTLVDNFEWHEGFIQKFGLFELDLLTKERMLKPGAIAYKEIIDIWKRGCLENKAE